MLFLAALVSIQLGSAPETKTSGPDTIPTAPPRHSSGGPELDSDPSSFLLGMDQPAPPFAMRDLKGTNFSLAENVGRLVSSPKRALLLLFFSKECETCLDDRQLFEAQFEGYTGRKLEVLHVGMNLDTKNLRGMFEEGLPLWPVIPDPHGLLAKRYGVSSAPHMVGIDSESKIFFQRRGGGTSGLQAFEQSLKNRTIPDQTQPKAEKKASPKPSYEGTLLIGRAAASEKSTQGWQALAKYLSHTINARFEIRSAESYADFQREVAEGRYHLIDAGPMISSGALDQYEPSVQLARHGTYSYFGIIFSKRSKRIRKLKHLRRKTIAMVSPSSTSGGLYPQKALLDAGFRLGKNIRIKWVGSHLKVAEAVKAGKAHAGACYEDCRDLVWPDLHQKMRSTRVLRYTDKIPPEFLMLRKNLEAPLKTSLHQALLALESERGVLASMSEGESVITNVAPADTSLLEKMRAMLAALKRTKGAKVP